MQPLSTIPGIREAQIRLREIAGIKGGNQSVSKPKIEAPNYATMPIEDLKALEQTADGWLKANKTAPTYDSALKRYKKLSHFLAARTNI